MNLREIYKLELTIAMFNRGCASFQQAIMPSENKDFSAAESALISAARDVADALEWGLKIYLEYIPKLSGNERRMLQHPNFNDLLKLMKTRADPPLSEETSIQMFGYRKMRNEATHQGAIPPVKAVQQAIEGVSQFLQTYLSVEESQLRLAFEATNSEATGEVSADDRVSSLSSTPVPEFNLSAVRRQLNQMFDDAELSAFCLDHFPEVYDKFGQGMRKDQKMTLLLDHCRRLPSGYQELLEALEEKTRQRAETDGGPRLSEDERNALQRQLKNYRENLQLIDERMAQFVEETEIPLTLIRNRRQIERRIEDITRQLNVN